MTTNPVADNLDRCSFVELLPALLELSDENISAENVGSMLGVSLVKTSDLGQDGVTYAGQSTSVGWSVELFRNAVRKAFNLRIDLVSSEKPTAPVKIADLERHLLNGGWTTTATINHPVRLLAFGKAGREVRITHDGIRAITFELLNV